MECKVVKGVTQRMRLRCSKPTREAQVRCSGREPPSEEWPPPTGASVLIIVCVALDAQAAAEGNPPPGPAKAAI